MAYICMHCSKETKTIEGFVRCVYCGGRILLKSRPNLQKEITTD
ncbi:MAG: DNA-directed RNA polymerase subunit P [Candidatus Marsarchaeota archaeon]|jgi:DNA-directed RNA polymerase subunit RPC12/RpoP|nr:DNA-directed RNA polymerase subunit P [Candidatus Marsarchaeota archaeon]